MRIIVAENLFGVYLALMHLTNLGKPHTVKNIADLLTCLSNPTISKALDQLERYGAIVAPKGLAKGARKGHTFSFTLNHSKFPRWVLDATSSTSTNRRNRIKAAEAGIARYVDGKCLFDADGFLSQCGDDLLNELTKQARRLDPKAKIDRAWVKKHLDGGEIEFSEKPIWSFLDTVHRFISPKSGT
jgi:hypothetical protein